MSGRVGDLSPYQDKVLREFKEAVADVHKSYYDDYYYLRWLRAREFDRVKAEAMMRKNLLWRKKMGADTILTDYKPPEILDKYYPRGLFGADNEGCPVRYMPFQYLDLRGFAFSLSKFEILKFLTYIFEQDLAFMKEESKRTGKVLEMHSYILDIEGYTFRQATNKHAVDMLNEVLKLYEANYPERLKVAYFINAPTYFSIVLALSKPFLSENTINKFKMFGKENFQEFLRSVMDPAILPAFLGGTKTDPDGDPRCKTVINFGGFIPKSYYFDHKDRRFAEEEEVKSIVLEKRSSFSLNVEVPKTGSKLQWEVETNSRDVGIGLFYRNSDDAKEIKEKLEDVLPIERVNCHLVPESCAYICEKPGTYVIKFDNSYSWFSQKKVLYRVTVLSPDQVDALE